MLLENTSREFPHHRHHWCGSWGPDPFWLLRDLPRVLAACGRRPDRGCRHVDNSTAVHPRFAPSTIGPPSTHRPSPEDPQSGPGRRGDVHQDTIGPAQGGRPHRLHAGDAGRAGGRKPRRGGGGSGPPPPVSGAARPLVTGRGVDLPKLCTSLGTTSRSVDRAEPLAARGGGSGQRSSLPTAVHSCGRRLVDRCRAGAWGRRLPAPCGGRAQCRSGTAAGRGVVR